MPAFTSIFKSALVLAAVSLWSAAALAEDSKTLKPEEDDFSSTPFTNYGEFNEEEEEAADTRFFQYGRFFGVSIGVGYEGVSGNRGILWQNGFPMVDFKVHYWFDFHFALDLGFFTAPHFYEVQSTGEHVDITMIWVGVDLKYYFDTSNLSAAISFANPFLLLGAGSFTKSQTSVTQGTTDSEGAFGLSAGAGLEFAVKPKKIYFQLEGKIHLATFNDTYTSAFQSTASIENLTGFFYTFTGNLLFTW